MTRILSYSPAVNSNNVSKNVSKIKNRYQFSCGILLNEREGHMKKGFWSLYAPVYEAAMRPDKKAYAKKRYLDYNTRLLLSLANAVGAGRMRQAMRELLKAYKNGIDSRAFDDLFEQFAWNMGIGFFSSEIAPSPLFQAYKTIKRVRNPAWMQMRLLRKSPC